MPSRQFGRGNRESVTIGLKVRAAAASATAGLTDDHRRVADEDDVWRINRASQLDRQQQRAPFGVVIVSLADIGSDVNGATMNDRDLDRAGVRPASAIEMEDLATE
jgi:anti-sigma-K factor RskA